MLNCNDFYHSPFFSLENPFIQFFLPVKNHMQLKSISNLTHSDRPNSEKTKDKRQKLFVIDIPD